MNSKSTVILAVLVVAVGSGLVAWSLFFTGALATPPAILDDDTRAALDREKTDQPVAITLTYRDRNQDEDIKVVLRREAGSTHWTAPGKWPTRDAEVRRLLRQFTALQTRFVPVPITRKNEADYGLEHPDLKVDIRIGDQKPVRMEFGQKHPGRSLENSYYHETFLRLEGRDEAIRLSPGIIESLSHPIEYYQQRWLFLPPETRIRDDSPASATRPSRVVKSIRFESKGPSPVDYALAWSGGRWELSQPVRDRPDPDKLKTILTEVPDIWVEYFKERNASPKDLEKYGLKNPEKKLSVTPSNGDTVTLLVGKESDRKGQRMRTISLPPSQPGQPPMSHRVPVPVKYLYAKLQGTEDSASQIFEIEADHVEKLSIPPDTLRDPHLARFRPEDAQKLELKQGRTTLVLERDKKDTFKWNLTSPIKEEAESSKVTEIIDKLSQLEATGADVIDKGTPAAYGLNPRSDTIRLTVLEESKDKAKTKTQKVFRFTLGKHDKDKLYVRVDDWKRINAVKDDLVKLADRPALAYRSRKVLDYDSADLARIDIRRPKDPFALEQVKDTWRLKAPVQAEVDNFPANQLAGDLSRLEAVDFVTDHAKTADLDKDYGLGKSALAAHFTFKDGKKKARTVLVGKQRAGKQEYYAKLADSPTIFVVRKDVHDDLHKSSLEYRPSQLWQMQPDQVAELRVHKDGPEYRLKRDGEKWHISGPFDAPAAADLARPMADELASFRAERYEAHFAKSLASYGLDKPYLRVAVTPKKEDKKKDKKKPPADESKEPREHILLVGKPVDKTGKTRFAKLGENEAIFVIGDKAVAALDHNALDLLDPGLLTLDTQSVQKVKSAALGDRAWTLARKKADKKDDTKEEWQVVASPAGAFTADVDATETMLSFWANLRAHKFAAYGPTANLESFGLKKPAVTITVTARGSKKKTSDHTLTLGNLVPGGKGQRYARVDDGPAVAILDADAAGKLAPTYLDLVNRSVLKLDDTSVTALDRRMGPDVFELVRKVGKWQITRPAAHPADAVEVSGLLVQLANLHAKSVAAYPARDLKPFGLDKPTAVITLRSRGKDKKPVEHVLKIAGPSKEKSAAEGDRYAMVDQSTVVFVLPADLAQQLTGAPLHFRDHDLASLSGIDRVEIDRGSRKVVFAKTDDTWKMTKPLDTDSESTELDDFLKSLAKVRAADLVADKPPSLKAYGLDRPEATWRFYTGDKEVLVLLVGSHEKTKKAGKETEGPRCYANLAKSDLVFLLDSGATNRALAEYRNRTVWSPAPDAAQVDELHYGYRSRPFVLKKVDNDWKIPDMPAAKVKADAVRAALDALAGLKVAGYVADKGGNLELFGLKEPALVMEIRSRSDTQKLEIGRQEGGSKRYYARVAGKDDNPVFLLAEADAKRIVRSMKDFTEPAKK
jgi:hypothetical protein